MSYQTEHPQFTMPDDVTIPEGFEDSSWHNDELPSWSVLNDEGMPHARIWIGYGDEGIPQFVFETYKAPNFDDAANVLESDDWMEILIAVAAWQDTHWNRK